MWPVFWLAMAVVLFIVESVTYQLVCIWFSVGAVFAMFAGFLHMPIWVQFLVFLVTSVLVLFFGRPLLKERLGNRKTPTNADLVVGQIGVVLEDINNDLQTGRVKANGLDWTARAVSERVIPAGEKVRAIAIDGVKLIVEPISVTAAAERE